MQLELVNTEYMLNIFNQIWMECWDEKGYGLEFSDKVLRRYVVNRAGSLEIKFLKDSELLEGVKYLDENGEEKEFNFMDYEHIRNNIDNVVEIDKLSILPDNRGEGVLEILLSLIVQTCKEENSKQLIALIEPKLGLALKRFYKVPITNLGKRFLYKGDYVQPMSFDPSLIFNNPEKFSWFKQLEAAVV